MYHDVDKYNIIIKVILLKYITYIILQNKNYFQRFFNF